jgi:hypothetical protein
MFLVEVINLFSPHAGKQGTVTIADWERRLFWMPVLINGDQVLVAAHGLRVL